MAGSSYPFRQASRGVAVLLVAVAATAPDGARSDQRARTAQSFLSPEYDAAIGELRKLAEKSVDGNDRRRDEELPKWPTQRDMEQSMAVSSPVAPYDLVGSATPSFPLLELTSTTSWEVGERAARLPHIDFSQQFPGVPEKVWQNNEFSRCVTDSLADTINRVADLSTPLDENDVSIQRMKMDLDQKVDYKQHIKSYDPDDKTSHTLSIQYRVTHRLAPTLKNLALVPALRERFASTLLKVFFDRLHVIMSGYPTRSKPVPNAAGRSQGLSVQVVDKPVPQINRNSNCFDPLPEKAGRDSITNSLFLYQKFRNEVNETLADTQEKLECSQTFRKSIRESIAMGLRALTPIVKGKSGEAEEKVQATQNYQEKDIQIVFMKILDDDLITTPSWTKSSKQEGDLVRGGTMDNLDTSKRKDRIGGFWPVQGEPKLKIAYQVFVNSVEIGKRLVKVLRDGDKRSNFEDRFVRAYRQTESPYNLRDAHVEQTELVLARNPEIDSSGSESDRMRQIRLEPLDDAELKKRVVDRIGAVHAADAMPTPPPPQTWVIDRTSPDFSPAMAHDKVLTINALASMSPLVKAEDVQRWAPTCLYMAIHSVPDLVKGRDNTFENYKSPSAQRDIRVRFGGKMVEMRFVMSSAAVARKIMRAYNDSELFRKSLAIAFAMAAVGDERLGQAGKYFQLTR